MNHSASHARMDYGSTGPAFAQRRARALLAAWNSGDLARLEAALDANSDSVEMHLPAIEQERFELIGEVVNAIRGWIDRAKTETELQAALLLLRHVGRTEAAYVPAASSHRNPLRLHQAIVFSGSRSI